METVPNPSSCSLALLLLFSCSFYVGWSNGERHNSPLMGIQPLSKIAMHKASIQLHKQAYIKFTPDPPLKSADSKVRTLFVVVVVILNKWYHLHESKSYIDIPGSVREDEGEGEDESSSFGFDNSDFGRCGDYKYFIYVNKFHFD